MLEHGVVNMTENLHPNIWVSQIDKVAPRSVLWTRLTKYLDNRQKLGNQSSDKQT